MSRSLDEIFAAGTVDSTSGRPGLAGADDDPVQAFMRRTARSDVRRVGGYRSAQDARRPD